MTELDRKAGYYWAKERPFGGLAPLWEVFEWVVSAIGSTHGYWQKAGDEDILIDADFLVIGPVIEPPED